jgi:membrane-bound lytic murein transglycosylase D
MVWLGEVESGFDAHARSPAGATGMFQLMPDTARALGLSLKPKDERQDPDRSAKAAAYYLRYLALKFRDWRLAVAAYNAGEGRIREALVRRKARTFDGIATGLPAETQMYVPKVEAVIQRREGVSLSSLPIA